MEIGIEEPGTTIEPIKEPVPDKQPAKQPKPVEAPPVKVPA